MASPLGAAQILQCIFRLMMRINDLRAGTILALQHSIAGVRDAKIEPMAADDLGR